MATKKISIHEATPAQLRQFLETHCGVPKIHPSTNKNTLLAKLATVHPGMDIEVDDVPPAARTDNVVGIPQEFNAPGVPAAPIAPDATHALGGMTSKDAPRVVVNIFNGSGEIGTQKVFLGWNTKGMLVERGKPQPIPFPYYEVLMNAVETQTVQTDDGEDIMTEVQAYPFQVLSMPAPEDIQAWRGRCQAADPTQKGNANYIGPPRRHRHAQ
jgi:hypothetical protein